MLTLKSALLLNGISSGVTGLGLIIFARKAAVLFEVTNKGPFIYTGIFLVLFAIFVIRTAMNENLNIPALKVISSLDLAWILGSITLLIAGGAQISVIGNALIFAVAAWVGLMAVLQFKMQKRQTRSYTSASAV